MYEIQHPTILYERHIRIPMIIILEGRFNILNANNPSNLTLQLTVY